MKYRFKFSKGDEIKFIGHLDMLRLFQKIIKIAKLPIAYSQGFNPHQLISFASPLSLGMTSEGEYGDFELTEDIENTEVLNRLDVAVPLGIKIIDIIKLRDKTQSPMASVEAAAYEIYLDGRVSTELLSEKLPQYLLKEEINILKQTKKNTKMEDIKPDIFELKQIEREDGQAAIYVFLAAGSRKNLKPELVLSSIYEFLDLEFFKYKVSYKRLDLYRLENGKYVSLNTGVER